eukprot:gene23300-30203_t
MTALLFKLTITLNIVIAVEAIWSEIYDVSKDWNSIKISENGVYQTAVVYGDKVYYSLDSGNYWTPVNPSSSPSGSWMDIGMSSNGQFQTVVEYGGLIYTSNNYGASWTASSAESSWWRSVAVTSSGIIQYAAFLTQPQQTTTGYIWKSENYGATWSQLPMSPSLNWNDLAVSGQGNMQLQHQNICIFHLMEAIPLSQDSQNTGIYISTDSGNSFPLSQAPSQIWRGIAVNSDNGQYITALSNGDTGYTGGYIYQYSTEGGNWTKVGFSGLWRAIDLDSTGQIQVAVVEYGGIYSNDNYGLDGTTLPTSSPSQTPTLVPFLAPTLDPTSRISTN